MGKKFLRGKFIDRWKHGEGLGGAVNNLLGLKHVKNEHTKEAEEMLAQNQQIADELAQQQSQYETNPTYLNAMSQLGDVYAQGGYTDSERAQMAQAQQDASNYATSLNNTAMANLAMQGMGGSGLDAMSQMQNAQTAATMAGDNANQIAVSGQERAMGALQAQGAMAGQQASGIDAYNQNVAGLRMGAMGQQAGFQQQQAAADAARQQQVLSNYMNIAGAAVGAPGIGSALGGGGGAGWSPSDEETYSNANTRGY